MNIPRRSFFGTMAAAAAAASLTALKPATLSAQTTLTGTPIGTIVSLNGTIVGLFSTLTDAQTYVGKQTTPASYHVESWYMTPAGQSVPLANTPA